MGYAAVASLSETIDIILKYHQDYTTSQFQNQIISLQKHSAFLQSFLEDFPDRGNNWDETIREVADRAEEIVELLLSDSWLESTVRSPKTKLERGKCEVHYDFDELEGVTEEMESIAGRVKGARCSEAAGDSDEEVMKIISRLREGSSALEVIPIAGSGGSGKTTLAKNAYIHSLTVEHFDLRAWSTVTSEYIRVRVIQDLLTSMKAEDDNTSNSEDQLSESLYQKLCRRRYLLVLDDVWSFEVLKRVQIMVPDYGNGSRIILTTRSSKLARSAGRIHEMSLLDEDRSWNLFREKIFKGDPCPSQLEYVGKEIARGCKGNRLSIKVVSGILAAADQTEAAWKDVSETMKITSDDYDEAAWADENMNSDDRERVQMLSLSYTYLPHHLRPCFVYLSIFPEDRDIPVSKLIKLWIAEGFVKGSECESFEQRGEEHVEDLARRNLVSVRKRKSNGRIKSIAVHDLIREVSLRQARKDNFALDVMMRIWGIRRPAALEYETCRRVSNLIYGFDFLKGVYDSTIRSIILYEEYRRLDLRCWMGNVRLLRILDLINVKNYDLSLEVFELFHLRYLAFHCGFSISGAISNLVNLQTLIIFPRKNDCGLFDKLPEGIWKMPQLRHLFIFHFKLPSHIGEAATLENLQTLSIVVDFICSRENLKMVPNLKKLALVYNNNLRDVVEDFELHNLTYMQNLEILKIEMDWSSFLEEQKMSLSSFPPTLKKLNLCGVQLPWEDMKIGASLPNLQVLKLRNNACIGETWETSEGGFPQLTYLLIEESNLKNWITKTSHFPRLKCLVLRRCLSLLEVPNDMGKISTLELIELDNQNHSLLSSAYRIQKDRQSLGYDHLQIRLV